jgi:hypothetical protein
MAGAEKGIEIGETLRLFTDGTGNRGQELLISSHGFYVPGRNRGKDEGNGWFKVPSWTTLYFYVPHGTPLVDPGITSAAMFPPKETYGPGQLVRNYRLAKYQGRHGSKGETYKLINETIALNRTKADGVDAERNNPLVRNDPAALELLKPIERYDVLTIRHRVETFLRGFHLRDVLRELDSHGYRYPTIKCIFCRSSMLYDLGDRPWTSLNK